MEDLVGDVGEYRGAAGGDAAAGDKDEEAGEKLAEVGAGGELRQEIGGEVFVVVVDGHRNGDAGVCLGVAEAKARVSWQTGKAAALAVGIKIGAAGSTGLRRRYDGIGDGVGANG